jgi:hypothetical protein
MWIHNRFKDIYKNMILSHGWCRKCEEKENFYMKNILAVRNGSKNILGTYEGTVQKPFGKT